MIINNEPPEASNIFEVNFTPDYFYDVLDLKDTWLAFMVILGVIFLILLLLFIGLRQRIRIAIKLIEQGSKAVGQMCSSLPWPIVTFTSHVLVAAWFFGVAMFISTMAKEEFHIHYERK